MIEYTVKVYKDGSKYWYLNNQFHREDGPAVEIADGTKEWYLNGNRHRADGPAYEGVNGDQFWWLNGERHREDGPACEWTDGTKEWYLNGEQLSEAEFNARTKTKELTVNEIERLLGYKIKIVGNA